MVALVVMAGPLVVGYDGSELATRALREAASLVPPSTPVLVVVVWESGLAFDLLQPSMPPAPIDIRTALEVDEAIYERARQLAEQGASAVRGDGRAAEALAIADELTVAETLVRLATERSASAVSIGTHGHRRALSEALLGSTSRDVVRHAPCPVILVADHDRREDEGQAAAGR
jgi:nucleotide-binding universal stress UspA family protein